MPDTMPNTIETDRDFQALADPYRRELLAHCYRMLGSIHDAEDLVQETYLRAWRSYGGFEGRSSLRTWLYRIATNVCLTAIDQRGNRPMPSGLGAPSDEPERPVVASDEVPWLEPAPDAVLGADAADPATIVTARESTRLAFVAALQHLPAKQRVVLILRDVLKWRAAEVAELLDTSTAAVNSALQRARAQLEENAPLRDELVEPTDPGQRDLLERYAKAFETADIASLIELFKQDVVWEMPPFPQWFVGADHVVRLILAQCGPTPGDIRMVPAAANGQPAFGLYMRDDEGVHRPYQIQVLSITGDGVAHVSVFFDTSLFPVFGLAERL
ncbi:sigma-70 family RNA polymerase sigma factor [Actinomadura sp. NPDC048955]|uniref:RNA polymerase sigma factor n=1 Tax=Actinomadura luteofluorescens TaxID=46163 RepID=A0A7Y9ERG8_9ACTN|nr:MULTISPECIES: sigma-70 family RNA polymerase sigma factor [Actinomadura]MCR3742755.1 RNA polymerase sigma-70 factor, ECF subfamily [Actinomadura glauciflava]NYD52605.1 RNA polymerase sigma-70 factor (ECF subfamily) [Actinomadura luteofluorescens]